ncbi:MAG: hypothetical protein AAF171_28650 [Cyanobacteria bacterium P01_A01_bin.116]
MLSSSRWLGEQSAYFCLRQKKSTHIQPHDEDWIALGELGLTPGTSCFYNQITVIESKGFGPVQVAGKWKRCYDGFAPDEPWFILTNLDNLDAAILAYQRRFSIEEMFRNLKLGGYCLEQTRVQGKRFMTMVLLIAIAYTCATTQGQRFKQKAVQRCDPASLCGARERAPRQRYIARPETKGRTHKRHGAFHIALTAYRWVPCWQCCQQQIQALLRLDRNKIVYHLRGLRAIEVVLAPSSRCVTPSARRQQTREALYRFNHPYFGVYLVCLSRKRWAIVESALLASNYEFQVKDKSAIKSNA